MKKAPIVVCMPDLFVDHFVFIKEEIESFFSNMKDIYETSGGNYRKEHVQNIHLGGNSVNIAKILTNLNTDIKPYLLCRYPIILETLLRETFSEEQLKFCKPTESPAMTIAFEFSEGNIMISDPGYLEKFSSTNLDTNEWEILNRADLVAITNFMAIDNFIEILKEVDKRIPVDTIFFIDVSDLRTRLDQISDFKEILQSFSRKTFLSLSINELNHMTGVVNDTIEKILTNGEKLSKEMPKVNFLIHSTDIVCHVINGKIINHLKPTKAKAIISTGAGDSWNSGFIISWLENKSSLKALEKANEVALKYITGKINF